MPVRIAAVVCLFSFGVILSAQQTTPPAPSQPSMSTNDMMSNCRTHFQRSKTTMSEMSKMMADAEKSNDPVKMRSALDKAQKSISAMQSNMDTCMSMMDKMHDHAGGMMHDHGMMQEAPKK